MQLSTTIRVAVFALMLPACSGRDGGGVDMREVRAPVVGGVTLHLTLPESTELSAVHYVLSDADGYSRTGSFPLEQRASPHAGFRVQLDNVPAQTGYTLRLDGAGDGFRCRGEASFNVTANAETSVTLNLGCRSQGTGAVEINGTAELCPTLDGLVATPAAESGSVELRALLGAQPTDPRYHWEASAGTLSTTDATATLHCPSAGGSVSVGVRVGDELGCDDQISVGVTCPVDWAHVPAVRPLYGVTIDDIQALDKIVPALEQLARRPTARVVFDPDMRAADYAAAVARIHAVSGVMGELVDSHAVAQVTVDDYAARTQEYLMTLADDVDLWEVGNEVNGEWLGASHEVVQKIQRAYDLVHAAHKPAALTLYYNSGCWEQPEHEMFRWVAEQLPNQLKQSLDYVLLSFYEDQCPGTHPDWNEVFTRLAAIFPNARLGFGECGTTNAANKAALIERYYSLQVPLPQYVGGYFWWYFREDMLPSTSALWTVLNKTLERRPLDPQP